MYVCTFTSLYASNTQEAVYYNILLYCISTCVHLKQSTKEGVFTWHVLHVSILSRTLGVLKQKTKETGYAALIFLRGPEICLHRLILHCLRSSKQWHPPCWDPLWATFISVLAVSVQLGDRNVSDSGAVQWECCLQPVKTPGRHIWSHLEPPTLEISPSLSTYAQRLSSLEVRRIHPDSCSPTFSCLTYPHRPIS